MPAPMPFEAPVTTATLPLRLLMVVLLLVGAVALDSMIR
jgi:hypothetical protein